MARYYGILFIASLSCLFLIDNTSAEGGQPGWQRDIIRQMYNQTLTGRKFMRSMDIYYSDVCDWPSLTCDLNMRITNLTITLNNFDYRIPPMISKLVDLEVLDATGGRPYAEGTIPDFIGNLTNLRFIKLFYAYLVGTIPESLGNLTKLEELHLTANSLTGTIPNSLANLPKIKVLNLEYNNFSGSIPDELARGSMIRLGLSGNRLTGSVPHVIFESNLQILLIQANQYTSLAQNIPRPPKLHICNMWDNRFVCPLPQWALDECGATCTEIEPLPIEGIPKTTIAIIIASSCAFAILVVLLALFVVRKNSRRFPAF